MKTSHHLRIAYYLFVVMCMMVLFSFCFTSSPSKTYYLSYEFALANVKFEALESEWLVLNRNMRATFLWRLFKFIKISMGKLIPKKCCFILYRYIEKDVYWFRCHNFLKRSTKDTYRTGQKVSKFHNIAVRCFFSSVASNLC